MAQHSTIHGKSRQYTIRQDKLIQYNISTYKAIQQQLRQDKITQDKTIQHNAIQSKSNTI